MDEIKEEMGSQTYFWQRIGIQDIQRTTTQWQKHKPSNKKVDKDLKRNITNKGLWITKKPIKSTEHY